MIKIAAVDDESVWLELEKQITEIFFGEEAYRFVPYSNVEKFLFELEEELFDIVLLDMKLPHTTGLEVAKKIKEKQFDMRIIYITSFVEYAVEAFEVNAFRYIPKNMLEEKLPLAYRALTEELEQKESAYFTIQNELRMERIPEDEIYYLRKEKKYVCVVHKHGESKARMTLEEAYKRLNSACFIQIDKSCIVNLNHVMALQKYQVCLRNGTNLAVSQPRLTEVKKRIAEYWREKC